VDKHFHDIMSDVEFKLMGACHAIDEARLFAEVDGRFGSERQLTELFDAVDSCVFEVGEMLKRIEGEEVD